MSHNKKQSIHRAVNPDWDWYMSTGVSKFDRVVVSVRVPVQVLRIREIWYNSIRTEEVMVGGAGDRPTANSEPRLKVSLHAAPQPWGLCHRHLSPVHPVMTVTVK
jgi:hypothetical protein